MATEVLGYHQIPVLSEDLEDLERESVVNSPKNEVEIQQQQIMQLKEGKLDIQL